jgi:quercetin dioxygenase-like cupin family protein
VGEKREPGEIEAAEVVLPCAELEPTLAFFTERLGFRVALVYPAEAPAVAVIEGHGLRLRLDSGARGAPGSLRFLCRDPDAIAGGSSELVAPNGTRVELVASDPPLRLPPLRPSFVLTRLADGSWSSGRAGMLYRDLIPDRQGGRFIASHIRIPDGGPVPDYVHSHRVRFQMIYCFKGWVRVVYEDQGPPFVLHAGDAALQPPRIRHRVLECSPGLEVIEVSCPAEHETLADFDLRLPTPDRHPGRDFGGQRFVRHEAARAAFAPSPASGFESCDLGIAAATAGLAGARVVRRSALCSGTEAADAQRDAHSGELLFSFALRGSATLHAGLRQPDRLAGGDAFVVPAGLRYSLGACSRDFELLEVALPAR